MWRGQFQLCYVERPSHLCCYCLFKSRGLGRQRLRSYWLLLVVFRSSTSVALRLKNASTKRYLSYIHPPWCFHPLVTYFRMRSEVFPDNDEIEDEINGGDDLEFSHLGFSVLNLLAQKNNHYARIAYHVNLSKRSLHKGDPCPFPRSSLGALEISIPRCQSIELGIINIKEISCCRCVYTNLLLPISVDEKQ